MAVPGIVSRPAKCSGEEPVQADLFGPGKLAPGDLAAVQAYEGGIVPPVLRKAYVVHKRAFGLRQEDVARRVGISRPQLASAMQGRVGLSPGAAARLKAALRVGP